MAIYINGEKIEFEILDKEIERLKPHYEEVFANQDPKQRQKQLRQWSKDNIIEQVVLRQQARLLEGDFSKEANEQYEQIMSKSGGEDKFFADKGLDISRKNDFLDDLELQARIKHLLERITKKASPPSNKEIEEFYNQNIDKFTIPEMLRASHIVKHIAPEEENPELFEKISAAYKELVQGSDFEEIVAKYSDCADNGGDLGYYGRGKMVQDFEDATFEMQVGEFSEIFRTEFGYHIAKLTDRKPPRVCPIDEVREYIIKQLTQKAQEKAVENFLDKKMAEAVVKED